MSAAQPAGTADAAKPRRAATTDFNKWDRVKMEDLGWTAEDEYRDRVTQPMQVAADWQSNQAQVRSARRQLEGARVERERLEMLADDIRRRRATLDRNTNIILGGIFAVAVALLMWAIWIIR